MNKRLQDDFSMPRRFAGCGVMGAVAAVACAGAHAAAAGSHPDITGNWESSVYDEKIDPALIIPEGPLQLTPAYAPKYEAMQALRKKLDDAANGDKQDPNSPAVQAVAERETSCLPYGMPYMMTGAYSLEILQARTHLTIVAEAMFEVRRIYLNQKQLPLADIVPGYEGRAVGHWEGDTLVVSTIGLKENTPLSVPVQAAPVQLPHSAQTLITERIRLVRPDVLQDSITVTDPAALAIPYRFTFTLLRLKNYETPEYVCDNVREKFENGKFNMDVVAPPESH